MTIEQFLALNEMEKVCEILKSGRLIAQKIEDGKRIFLYHLHSFYVTAYYLLETDQLTDIIAHPDNELTIPTFRKFQISIHPAEREYDDTPKI